MVNIKGSYTAVFYDYVQRELKFEVDLPYEKLKKLKDDLVEFIRAANHQ
jgi:carboxypeptidase C (cathepsin A)